jgi:peptide/nickel transport system substrate-binding protein
VYRGHAKLTGPVPSALAEWAIDVSDNPFYKTDINKAKQLMAEAGVPNGFRTTIMAMATIPSQVESAQVIQSQLKRIGIDAEIQPLEVGVYVDNWRRKAMLMMVGGNNGGTNPDRAVAFFFSTRGTANVWNFSDERIDDLAARAPALTSRVAAKQLYDEAQRRIIELAPNLFLANPNDFIAYLPRVVNYKPMPDQTFQYLMETYLAR